MALAITRTDDKICLQIMTIWHNLKTTIEDFAVDHDLTLQQIFVLYELCNEDHILMGTLAKHLHCDASNVTGLVDRLQVADLITRHELPTDRRAKQLTITAQGRQLIEGMIPHLPASLSMQRLTVSEIDSLYCLLDKMISV